MYAGLKVNWHEIVKNTRISAERENLPLFAVVFSSPKGVEHITDFTAQDFFDMYGDSADFFKYGQPLLEAHNILNNGGRVFGYRLVADDATLANIIISAEVEQKQKQKTNSQGQPLFLDGSGQETTEATGNTPVNVNYASVKYSINTIQDAKNINDVVNKLPTIATATKFPLFVVADNGRGVSVKKVKITPDYTLSKSLEFCMYTINDIENNSVKETVRFSVNPNAKYAYNGKVKSMDLTENSTVQFETYMDHDQLDKFIEAIGAATGFSKEELYKYDVLFGATSRGTPIDSIVIDTDTGINLNHQYGLELQSGSNGEFGEAPCPGVKAPIEAWTKKATKFFEGTLTDEVWDVDLHRIDFIVDANYPNDVKAAINKWVGWRQDVYYFRDLGTSIYGYDDVALAMIDLKSHMKSPFAGDYCLTGDIIDPYSKKQIKVTGVYGLVRPLIKYYASNLGAPLAGEFNGFVIDEFIGGTLNFAPRVTPKVNQREMLDDLRVNYAIVTDNGKLVIQSLYTSYDNNGPLMYCNNTIVTQMAVKSIRAYTPKIRFQLVDSNDFSQYKQLIEDNALANFKKYFKSLSLIYTKDDELSSKKIFNASLECYYKDFAQSEIFDVYAIDGNPDGDSSSYTTNVIDITSPI